MKRAIVANRNCAGRKCSSAYGKQDIWDQQKLDIWISGNLPYSLDLVSSDFHHVRTFWKMGLLGFMFRKTSMWTTRCIRERARNTKHIYIIFSSGITKLIERWNIRIEKGRDRVEKWNTVLLRKFLPMWVLAYCRYVVTDFRTILAIHWTPLLYFMFKWRCIVIISV